MCILAGVFGSSGNEVDMDKRRDRSTDTMLERILNEGDEEKGRHQRFRKFRDGIIANVHILRIADPHEADIVVDGFSLAPEGNETPFAIIEDIAHHAGEENDGRFGLFGVDVDQSVDIIERVHEEVRIDLIFQILHLLLKIPTFQLGDAQAFVNTLERELDCDIGSEEKSHSEDCGQFAGNNEVDRHGKKPLFAIRTTGPAKRLASSAGIVGRTGKGTLDCRRAMGTSTEKGRIVAGNIAVGHGEEAQENHCERKIERSPVVMDKMGSNEMIVDDEAHTEDPDQFPKMDDFMPEDALLQSGRNEIGGVDRLLQTAYDEGEEESREPKDEIDKLFIPFDMLDHEWDFRCKYREWGEMVQIFLMNGVSLWAREGKRKKLPLLTAQFAEPEMTKPSKPF